MKPPDIKNPSRYGWQACGKGFSFALASHTSDGHLKHFQAGFPRAGLTRQGGEL